VYLLRVYVGSNRPLDVSFVDGLRIWSALGSMGEGRRRRRWGRLRDVNRGSSSGMAQRLTEGEAEWHGRQEGSSHPKRD